MTLSEAVWEERCRGRLGACGLKLASYLGLLIPAFVTCSIASDKRWGEKAWV